VRNVGVITYRKQVSIGDAT